MFVEIERVRGAIAVLAGTAVLVLGATACDEDGVTGPINGGAPAFSQEITLPELDEALTAGPVRVEVELLPGGMTAREVELELPEKLMDAEEIEDRISSISVAGDDGELTLQSTGLTVEFNSSTRFEGEDRDLTLAEFVERVENARAAGRFPAVEAKRDPPAEPQAPDDPTFVANRLELDDEAEEPKIELNVDRDNLELNSGGANGEPDAWIHMLGLRIELRVSEGVTELEQETAEAEGEAEFEGVVRSVDPTTSPPTVTLTSGAIIEIVPETRIEDEADDDDRLTSLDEVQAALDDGEIVEADGEGVVRVQDPLTITAVTIEFEIEDDERDVPGTVEFEDRVMTVDAAGGTFTLANGTLVEMNGTTIDPEGDLLSLEAVADAVADGQNVRAEGDANVVSTDPRVLSAMVVKFEVDEAG